MCLRFVKMFPHSRNLLSIIPKILGVQIVHLNYIYRESKFKTDSPKDTQTPLWLSLCTKRKFKIQVEFFHTILSLPLKKIFNRQQIIINCVQDIQYQNQYVFFQALFKVLPSASRNYDTCSFGPCSFLKPTQLLGSMQHRQPISAHVDNDSHQHIYTLAGTWMISNSY